MKHHLYQIYYGGFKIKLTDMYYCKICDLPVDLNHKKINISLKKLHYTTKKQSGNP